MTIRKKVIDGGQVTYPIDTLIFNVIKKEKKNWMLDKVTDYNRQLPP